MGTIPSNFRPCNWSYETIFTTRTVNKTTSISGNVDFIPTIATPKTVSSAVAYSMTVSNHDTYYLGYRTRFKIEESYRVKDTVFGGTYREYYKIKVPLYEHYQLIRGVVINEFKTINSYST